MEKCKEVSKSAIVAENSGENHLQICNIDL